jgi:Rab3 GTPase-activating protein catalytic subunit
VEVPIPYFLPTHTQPYRLTLFFPPRAPPLPPPAAAAGAGAADAATPAAAASAAEGWAPAPSGAAAPPSLQEDPFPAGAHRATRLFGVREFLLLAPASASRCCLDADEAAAVASALACARAGSAAPWPGFIALHDPSRGALLGGAGEAVRFEADAVAGSRAAAWLAAPSAQIGLLQARARAAGALRAAPALAAAPPDAFAAATGAAFAVRAYYDLPPPEELAQSLARAAAAPRNAASALDRIAGARRSASSAHTPPSSDSDDDASETDTPPGGGGKSGANGRRRFGLYIEDWDEGAPWAPWVSLSPPFHALQLAATWRDVPVPALLAAEEEGRPMSDVLTPESAHAWALRAAPDAHGGSYYASLRRDSGSNVADAGGGEGDDGGARRGSLGGMLHGLAAAMRAAAGAESQGALSTGEHWESPASASAAAAGAAAAGGGGGGGGGGVPRAPPEHVLQDVLRDVFEALPLPPGLGGGARRSAGAGGGSTADLVAAALAAATASAASTAAAAAPPASAFSPPPPRCCPAESLLARVALHALAFGNARAVAILWERVVRDMRFLHWERGVPLPRMASDASASPDGVPDFAACLMHQKLQLLNICIARRADDAAAAARAAAEARERGGAGAGGGDGATPPPKSRARAAHEARAAAEAAAAREGWDQGWEVDDEDDEDGWADASSMALSPAPSAAPSAATLRGGGEDGFATASEGSDASGDDADADAAGGEAAAATADADADVAASADARAASEEPPEQAAAEAAASARVESDAAASVAGGAASAAAAADGDGDALFEVGPPRGVASQLPQRLLRWPHSRAHAPRTQRAPALTEDALRDREAALAALGDAPGGAAARARLQADTLFSDMCAFKAANLHQGGGVMADFVRWHSPRDWLLEEAEEAAAEADGSAPGGSGTRLSAARAPRGRLSPRMAAPGNLWAQLWSEARPAAAAEQKPLQDAVAAGESALHWMETLAPADVFASLLGAAGGAVGALLAAAPGAAAPSAAAALRDAAAAVSAVLARPCPYPEEWRAMCDALAAAEAVAARAEWLRRRLPGAPHAAEALLAQSVRTPAHVQVWNTVCNAACVLHVLTQHVCVLLLCCFRAPPCFRGITALLRGAARG